MKEKLKKQIGVIWAVIFLVTLGIQGGGIMTQAATSVSCVPITCYTISTGRVNTYSLSNGRYTYTGYISGSTDKCVIQQVRTDGYCKVKYPVSRGYKTAYAQSAQFFVNTDFSLNTVRLGDRKTVYRRSNLSQTLGTVYADDNVIIIGTSGNATQIIYPISGGYKMGFVSGHYSSSGEQQANISDGYYQIISALNKDYVLDVYGGSMDDEANVQLYKNQRSINQGFLIRKQSDGYYTIAAIHSNKLLDVYKNQMFNGANIIQFSPTGGDNQKWKIVKTQDGYYSIISKSNGLYMDVKGGGIGNEVNVWCYSGNGTMAQKFILQSATVGGKAYQGEGQQSETSGTNADAVASRLQGLIDQYVGMTWNGYYYGIQCKGFGNLIFNELFHVYIGAYDNATKSYIPNPNGAIEVGRLTYSDMSQNNAKALLQKGQPGDYIQVRRRGKSYGHTMILVNSDANGITVFDCNSDGRNGVRKYYITWSQFYNSNSAMSLYHARNYK